MQVVINAILAAVDKYGIVQVVINILLAVLAIYSAIMSTYNQLQIRKQMRRVLLVKVDQAVKQLPRIPDDMGGRKLAPVVVFIINVTNPGLVPVTLKGVGITQSNGKLLAEG